MRLFDVARPLLAELPFVFLVFGCGGGRRGAADVGDGEDGFPAGEDRVAVRWGWVAETGRGESALGPAVRDAGEVPVYLVGACVAVELVADVDEVLDGGDVDVVDGGEVEDDGFEGGFGGVVRGGAVAAGPGVVPGTVLVGERVSGVSCGVW